MKNMLMSITDKIQYHKRTIPNTCPSLLPLTYLIQNITLVSEDIVAFVKYYNWVL